MTEISPCQVSVALDDLLSTHLITRAWPGQFDRICFLCAKRPFLSNLMTFFCKTLTQMCFFLFILFTTTFLLQHICYQGVQNVTAQFRIRLKPNQNFSLNCTSLFKILKKISLAWMGVNRRVIFWKYIIADKTGFWHGPQNA